MGSAFFKGGETKEGDGTSRMDVLGRPLKIWKYIHACLKRLPVKAETLFFSQHCSSLKTSMGENVKPQELELDRSIYCDNVTSYT